MPDVSAFTLRNLAQPPADNLAGIEAAWYCLATDLVDFPAEGELIIDQLSLRPGATWYQLLSTRGTVRYQQDPKDLGRHGQSFVQKLVGVLARHSGELAQGLEALDGQPLVLLYRDFNGRVQLVGTPEQPLKWTDKYDSGVNPTQRNNYDWSLVGETPRRARPYLGTWLVSGVGLNGSLELAGGPRGTVEIRDRHGNLMATVPAGRTVVVRSGFRVAYTIL